jgi:eukaryotic-like serine/threonine-protein kinase
MENTNLDPGARSTQGPHLPILLDRPNGAPPELRSLGDYRLLRRLGEGGMGAVYLGYEVNGGRQVALKILNDALIGNQGYVDRFYREARSGRLLDHPHIVRTYDVGQDRATSKHYLVMEYVDGPSAQALMAQRGPLPVGDAVHLALQMARALEHAHSRNIIHRDIKPDNILLTRSGVAKLGDMGLAKRTDDPNHLTVARQGFGTTAYMPYEQAVSARSADHRSDLYALGATLYHLLTGQVPFPGENHLEVVEKKKQGWFRPASSLAAEVPPALDAILARMLACLPRDRYQTASELIIDLERSRLAAAVPTFADPDLARHDPEALALMASSSEPTRLDPETPVRDAADEWIVKYKNRAGRALTTRLSTEDAIERLKQGTLPADATARRPSEEEARPLAEVPEFFPFLPPEQPPGEAEAEAKPEQSVWPYIPILVPVAAVLAGLLSWGVMWLRAWVLGGR